MVLEYGQWILDTAQHLTLPARDGHRRISRHRQPESGISGKPGMWHWLMTPRAVLGRRHYSQGNCLCMQKLVSHMPKFIVGPGTEQYAGPE